MDSSSPAVVVAAAASSSAPSAPQTTPKQDAPTTRLPNAAPFHLLMMSSPDKEQELLWKNPSLQSDYLGRRYKCQNHVSPENNPAAACRKKKETLWTAATALERAMVGCCEVVREADLNNDQQYDDENDDDNEYYQGGALVRGREFVFVELLARHCHTPATRALALAILEHTLEQDELDAEEEEEEDKEKLPSKEETCENKDDVATREIESAENNAVTPETVHESGGDFRTDSNLETRKETPRMIRFLEAGGLRILKQWLVDAMTPIKVSVPAAATAAGTTATARPKKAASMTTKKKPSPTGPLLIPLLSVLEKMPMDKNLVTETKINKQVRNLKKQLDEAVGDNKHGDSKALERWQDPVAGGLVVVQVQKAVESLMEKWKERVKTSTLETADPFVALRDRMRERLNVLVEYEAGKADDNKPEWLASFEESERIAKEKKAISKLTTRQLESRERQQEREKVLKAMQDRQQEVKQQMSQLLKKKEEESRKRKAVQQGPMNRKRSDKKVRWKDGFDKSDNLRKRKLLEDVYYYPSERSILAENAQDGIEEEGEEKASLENEDDDFDMFEESNCEPSSERGSSLVDTSQNDYTAVFKQEPD